MISVKRRDIMMIVWAITSQIIGEFGVNVRVRSDVSLPL
jgi:hypothetical protein